MDGTFDIHQAADFLKVDRTTALELAQRGDIPGARIGRAWVFLREDLQDYLRDRVRQQTNKRREQAEADRYALAAAEPAESRRKGRPRREPPKLAA